MNFKNDKISNLKSQISNLKSQISNLKIVQDNNFYQWLFLLGLIVYLFFVARLLGYKKDPNIIFIAFIFILASKYKLIFKSLIIFSTFFSIILSPCGVAFGKLNQGFIFSALVADKRHIYDFVTSLPLKLYVYVSLVLFLGYILTKYLKPIKTSNKTNIILVSLIVLNIFYYGDFKQYVNNKIIEVVTNTNNFLIKEPYNLYITYKKTKQEFNNINKSLQLKPIWQPVIKEDKFTNYVVVIGESMRRDAMHNYGYKLNNTPFLSNALRTQFNNYLSPAAFTGQTLLRMLILDYPNSTNLADSAINLANLSGFTTYWLSNQFEVGVSDSRNSLIGKQAQHHYFLNDVDSYLQSADDMELLPHIKNTLSANKATKKVIFVHLYGSHNPFCNRTQGKYDVYLQPFNNRKKDRYFSCYVQSIKNTDNLLKNIHAELEQNKAKTGENWALVYFSDHGLSFNDDNLLLHNENRLVSYQVPFVVLDSSMTETKFINAPRSGYDFIDFFAKWLGVYDENLPNSCNFVSEEECPNAGIEALEQKQKLKLEQEPHNFFN